MGITNENYSGLDICLAEFVLAVGRHTKLTQNCYEIQIQGFTADPEN